MIAKIIFSDNTLMVIKTSSHAMTKSLKKIRDDDDANDILARFKGEYDICDDEDAEHAGTSVDLRNKKNGSHTYRSKMNGEKYR